MAQANADANILQGKVTVITGGTRGLGFAIAQAYAAAGATVVVASRSQEAVHAAVQQLRSTGRPAHGFAADVGNREQVEALAELAVQACGRIDVWVNNAGMTGPYGPTMGTPPQAFEQVVHTNILGTYYGSHAAMRRFLAQKSGKLINLLGRGYQAPVPWQNAYGASKAWVRSFTLALAEETKGSGVGVFAFNPGMVLTELLTDVEVIAGSEPKLKNFPAIVRMWAKPPEVPAAKAVWIASPATDGKTGELISIFSRKEMVGGAVREGLRSLLRKPAPPVVVKMHTVPYDGA